MKKLLPLVITVLLLQTLVFSAEKRFEPGRYTCPYYYNGADHKCNIDVNLQGQAETSCSFLSLDLIKTLLNGKKCKFRPYEYFICNYPGDSCEVIIGIKNSENYADCDKNANKNRAIKDAQNGMCAQIYDKFYDND